MSQIHATSLVENGAVIGKNVEIGPFCHVGANVSIGDGCILKSHVVIDGWTTLGKKKYHLSFYQYRRRTSGS